MSAQKYIPLIDEFITRNPVAVRHNAIRLGLVDEGFQLSRQSLMVSISEWKTKNNATEQDVATMIREVLNVDAALQSAIKDMIQEANEVSEPRWMLYALIGLVVLGVFTALFGGVKLIQKLFQ
jgi:hypothetical protein